MRKLYVLKKVVYQPTKQQQIVAFFKAKAGKDLYIASRLIQAMSFPENDIIVVAPADATYFGGVTMKESKAEIEAWYAHYRQVTCASLEPYPAAQTA